MKKYYKKVLLHGFSILTLVLATSTSSASEDDEGMQALAQELFLGETAFVQEQSETQIGAGFGRLEFPDKSSDSELMFGIEYGITDELTIGLEIPYLSNDTAPPLSRGTSGLGDAGLSLLYSLVNTESFLLTAGAEFNLRTGDEIKGLGEEESEWEPSISMVSQLGEAQLMIGLGAEISDDETATNYTAAIAFPMGSAIGIFELSGETSEELVGLVEIEEKIAYATPGLLWKIGDEMEFQLGIPVGLNDDSADWGLVMKWNIEFD